MENAEHGTQDPTPGVGPDSFVFGKAWRNDPTGLPCEKYAVSRVTTLLGKGDEP
jgi:hypothetical protein